MAAQPERLCVDAGYAGEAPRETMTAVGDEPHVCPRGEEKREKAKNSDFKARRLGC
ncbi:MAG: hypothetical protein LBS77_03480 [Desulfovibrio sp.]|jgi:hypothetical protein|nr:hypothetical protein [Desulfovibrio sp.]